MEFMALRTAFMEIFSLQHPIALAPMGGASGGALAAAGVLPASLDDRSRVSDIARGSTWPSRYAARTLRNHFFDR